MKGNGKPCVFTNNGMQDYTNPSFENRSGYLSRDNTDMSQGGYARITQAAYYRIGLTSISDYSGMIVDMSDTSNIMLCIKY